MKLNKNQTGKAIAAFAAVLMVGTLVAQNYPGMEAELNELLKDAKIKVDKANDRVIADAGSTTDKTDSSKTDATKTDANKNTGSETVDISKLKPNVYSDGKTTFATSATKFELLSSDQLSSLNYVEYKINEDAYQKYTEAFQIKKEGPHRVLYRSVDKVGNFEAESVFLVVIDNSAPIVNLTSNATYHIKNGVQFAPGQTVVEIKATDSYSGVKSIVYSLGDQQLQDYKTPINLDKEGSYAFKYKSVDNLGNESELKEFTMIIDVQPPTLQVKPSIDLVDIAGVKYSQRSNTFAIDAKDESSGVAKILIKVDGEKDFRLYSTPIFFSEEGKHTIEAKAIDYVGNESKSVATEFIVDNNPPKTVIRPQEKK